MTSRYRVGDHRDDHVFLRPDEPGYDSMCEAAFDAPGEPAYGCTWPSAHTGEHIATTPDGEIMAIWPWNFGRNPEAEPVYHEGDHDPTPDSTNGDFFCGFTFSGSHEAHVQCTWPPGHEGQHVAGDGDYVVGVHPATDPIDPKEVEEALASIAREYRP